eukprot:7175966-Ditylum_brightwellii.AAC.1
MVHPCNHALVGIDDNTIGCLTSHSNSAGADGIMLFHGVDDSVDGSDKHLTHLTQAVDCHLKMRMKQNTCGPNAMISRSVVWQCKFNWCKRR